MYLGNFDLGKSMTFRWLPGKKTVLSAGIVVALLAGNSAYFANANRGTATLDQILQDCKKPSEQGWFSRLLKSDYQVATSGGAFELSDGTGCDNLIDALNQVKSQIEQQETAVIVANTQVTKEAAQRLALEQQIGELSTSKKLAEDQYLISKKQMEGMTTTLSELQLELSASGAELAQTQAELLAADVERETLLETITRLEKDLVSAKGSILEMADKLAETSSLPDSENQQANDKLQALEAKWQLQASTLENRLKRTQAELVDVQKLLVLTQTRAVKAESARTNLLGNGAAEEPLIQDIDNSSTDEVIDLLRINAGLRDQIRALRDTAFALKNPTPDQQEPIKELVQSIEDNHSDIGKNGEQLVLGNALVFDPASSYISKRGKMTLKDIASKIKDRMANDENWHLSVEGHTDSRPISSRKYPSNWHLGAGRAANVVRFLIKQGVPAHNLSAVSMASLRPISEGSDRGAHAQNRRVELRFTSH
jgi:chemotaxis protein MotB